MDEKTIFSPDRRYRYTLFRRWELNPYGSNFIKPHMYVQFAGLNPSTADEVQDDPTVRRCINFAKSWGYSVMCMTNIFAFRATDPELMKAQDDPIGIENNDWLCRIAREAHMVVACWGTHGAFMGRHKDVVDRLKKLQLRTLYHFSLTEGGYPRHPLYLKASLVPIRWQI